MQPVIKLIPRSERRPAEESQRILSFLLTVPFIKPISLSSVKALAKSFAIAPSSLTVLILVHGGEVMSNGKLC